MSKKNKKELVKFYIGEFIMNSGYKIKFKIDQRECEDYWHIMYNDCELSLEKGSSIWLGEYNDIFVQYDKIIAFSIHEVEEEEL